MANPTTSTPKAAQAIVDDFVALTTSAATASLKTTFELQNAALANSQTLFDQSASLAKDALSRWSDVARQAQAATLKTYQVGAQLLGSRNE